MSAAERNRMLANMKARANKRHVEETHRLLSQPGLAAPARSYRVPNAREVQRLLAQPGLVAPTHRYRPPRAAESLDAKLQRLHLILQQRRRAQEAKQREMEQRLKMYAALRRRRRP